MKRIRNENINTGEHFDELFTEQKDVYSSYNQIKLYDTLFSLGLFAEGTILDYGCGNANSLAQIVTEKKLQGIGVDISSTIIQKNKNDFPTLIFKTVEEFNSSVTISETVICTHTLEHTDNPLEIAEKLLSVATKKLFIIVPYKESWNKCPEHLWEFDKNSFNSLSPTLVLVGKVNEAGYTEIMYFWDKTSKKKPDLLLKTLYTIKLIKHHSLKGIIKKILHI